MKQALPRRTDLLVAACFAVGLYDTLYVIFALADGPVIGPALDAPYVDFLVFHGAARAFLEAKLALIYDLEAFTRYQNALYPSHLPFEVLFRPFLYPPIWLLILLPFGLVAVGKAYGLFMAATAALATALQGRRDWWGWLAVVTSPAAVWVVLAGQNTFLSVALLHGGLHLLGRAPVAAGILLGLLAYKPQILALVPLALLAARQWRALAATAATVIVLSVLSLGVFGPSFWLAFLEAAREATSPAFTDEMFRRMYMHMTTLVAAARLVGLSPTLSGALQLAGVVVAIGAVWFAFSRPGAPDARVAVLVTATLLVSPYTLNYDLLLLMPAVVALYRCGMQAGFLPFERFVHVALWLMPTFGMILNGQGVPVVPLVMLGFGTIALMRLPAVPKVELPTAPGPR